MKILYSDEGETYFHEKHNAAIDVCSCFINRKGEKKSISNEALPNEYIIVTKCILRKNTPNAVRNLNSQPLHFTKNIALATLP